MPIVPAEIPDAAQAIHTLHWPAGEAERNTSRVPLSSTGLEPATHYATYTSATDALWAAMQELMTDGQYLGLVWYRLDRNQTELLETNSETAVVGGPWEFTDALDDLGLQLMEVDDGI